MKRQINYRKTDNSEEEQKLKEIFFHVSPSEKKIFHRRLNIQN